MSKPATLTTREPFGLSGEVQRSESVRRQLLKPWPKTEEAANGPSLRLTQYASLCSVVL